MTVDHTRVKLKDIDTNISGSEYINANYIRQPTENEQSDINSSLENLNATTICAACQTVQQQKNCTNCQTLNKMCVQCAMKAALIPLSLDNCFNCGKKNEVSFLFNYISFFFFCSFKYIGHESICCRPCLQFFFFFLLLFFQEILIFIVMMSINIVYSHINR